MKKLLIASLTLLLISTALLVAGEMTADDLIANYIKAIGGKDNLAAIKSVYTEGSVFTQGMSLTLRAYRVPPEKAYSEVLMNDMVVAGGGFNGKDAWQRSPMGVFLLEGEMKESAMKEAVIFPLLDYKDRGATVKYLGEDLVKGKKAHKLEFAEAGDTSTLYFDAETWYMTKRKDASITASLSKYKKIGDVFMPHKLSISSAQGTQMITFDSIAFNVEVPESLFVTPADAKPMPKMPTMPGAAEQGDGQ